LVAAANEIQHPAVTAIIFFVAILITVSLICVACIAAVKYGMRNKKTEQEKRLERREREFDAAESRDRELGDLPSGDWVTINLN
jgi:Na+-transporting NADH:ubiquinone oxidoreductase subunit NqrC